MPTSWISPAFAKECDQAYLRGRYFANTAWKKMLRLQEKLREVPMLMLYAASRIRLQMASACRTPIGAASMALNVENIWQPRAH